jgi:hypothetical protein
MSANKLRNTIINIIKRKISPNLIVDLLNHLENAYLLFSVPIYSYKIKDQKQYPKKIYCIDTGLINTVSFRFTEDTGKLYENVVAVELKRRKKEIYYWKDANHWEVDFVLKDGLKVTQLIQVCYDTGNPETKNRELKSLVNAGEEFKCGNLLVITNDYESEEEFKGEKIKFMPLWKWLIS